MLQFRRDKKDPEVFHVFGPASEFPSERELPTYVPVTKRNGEIVEREIFKLSRAFNVDGEPHCYGFTQPNGKPIQQGRRPSPSQRPQAAPQGRQRRPEAVAPAPRPRSRFEAGVCHECGEPNVDGTVCWETGLIHG